MSSYGSPMIDLIYFLYTSAKEEIRFNMVSEMIQIYHSSLEKALTQLSLSDKVPSIEQLHSEWNKKYFHGKIS